MILAFGAVATAAEPQWIWHAADDRNEAPAGTRFFRKTFDLQAPEGGRLEITCDDEYKVFLNGKVVGRNQDWATIESIDVSKALKDGANRLAKD